MAHIIILGSASAVSDERQENTHMFVLSGSKGVLIDCPGNPVVRLKQAGIEYDTITDIVLTHFHPDHVSGFALLVMDLWLMGRKDELHIWGLGHTIERAQATMQMYTWNEWPNVYPVEFHTLPDVEMHVFIHHPDLRMSSSPVKHLIPTLGVRMEFPQEGKVVTYSSDTEPFEATVRLAQDSHVLIHEAAGGTIGHSSPQQAGLIATQAGAEELYLIHYSEKAHGDQVGQEAQITFSGPVKLARDFMKIPI